MLRPQKGNSGVFSNDKNAKQKIRDLGLKMLLFCNIHFSTVLEKVIMQEKLFLYCSVLSLGANVNTRRISKPDMGSIFHIKNH